MNTNLKSPPYISMPLRKLYNISDGFTLNATAPATIFLAYSEIKCLGQIMQLEEQAGPVQITQLPPTNTPLLPSVKHKSLATAILGNLAKNCFFSPTRACSVAREIFESNGGI